MLKPMDGYNWWWKEDDNCNEGILLQLSLPGVFVLLWAQLSREASIFMMLKTDGKISNTSQKSDKKKNNLKEIEQLSRQMWWCLYLKPSFGLVFLPLLSQQTEYRGEGQPQSSWSSGCVQGLTSRECLSSPFTDLLWEPRLL